MLWLIPLVPFIVCLEKKIHRPGQIKKVKMNRTIKAEHRAKNAKHECFIYRGSRRVCFVQQESSVAKMVLWLLLLVDQQVIIMVWCGVKATPLN